MFCFHYWRRREPPGSLSIGVLFREMDNDHVVFVSSEHFSLVFVEPISFDTLLRRKYFDTLLRCNNLHEEITCFVSTIGDDGSRQVPLVSAFFFEKWKTIMLFLCQAKNFHWFLSSRFRLTHFCDENILTHFCEENILSKNAV